MCEITDKNFSIFSGVQKTFDNQISIKINERLIKNKPFHFITGFTTKSILKADINIINN